MSQKITQSDFEQKVLKSDILIVVDFGAAWCGPCKKIPPILAELEKELPGKVHFFEVDAGVETALALSYQVMSLPTLLFFKSGKLVDKLVGSASKDKINSLIQKHV